jgi:hypothetical protein
MRLSTYSLALVIVLITSGKVFSAESVYHTDAPILESGGPLDPTCENTLRTTRATCSRAKIEEYPRCKHSDPVQERICVADTCMKKKYPSGSATSEAICARGYDMYGGTKNGAAINQGEARPQV